MDLQRLLADETSLAVTWLLVMGTYALLLWRSQFAGSWTAALPQLWQLVGIATAILVLLLFGLAVGHLWFGGPLVLGRLLAGLSIVYAPLHLIQWLGLFSERELVMQLAHYRQAFYPVLTVMALVIIIRALAYNRPEVRDAQSGS